MFRISLRNFLLKRNELAVIFERLKATVNGSNIVECICAWTMNENHFQPIWEMTFSHVDRIMSNGIFMKCATHSMLKCAFPNFCELSILLFSNPHYNIECQPHLKMPIKLMPMTLRTKDTNGNLMRSNMLSVFIDSGFEVAAALAMPWTPFENGEMIL